MKCSLRQGLPQIQVIDQLSVLLRTPPTAPTYDDEWHSFVTVLEAHADEEEREMIPVPASVKISDAELVELGDQMATRIEQLRESTVHKLRVKGRKSMLRALQSAAIGYPATLDPDSHSIAGRVNSQHRTGGTGGLSSVRSTP